ncbi:hypothetical protein FOMPIDRAFT_1116360 [Fomitopsis schrenkii]|uniref:Uncharacterized protein n=1 Tax=Fomitopsis schrenkii TaxID=2126942 RepID=S8EGD8_FOMSC|nr:hypothetical protein FOMPIDRAFT_1116360 [Fomitopsis schrenkii]
MASRSHHRCTRSTAHQRPCAGSVSVCHRAQEQSAPVNHNAPQCCHCGWRGDHAPTCPFK